MNTYLSSSQAAQKEQYIQFCRSEAAPKAALLEKQNGQLKDFFQSLGQQGYLGINVPKEYGGQSGSFLDLTLFVEALGQQDAALALMVAHHAAVIEVIKQSGSDTQKSRYLPLLAREILGTIGFSEEQAGTDFEAVTATAKTNGNDYKLSGKKTFVFSGEVAQLMLVLVKSESEQDLALHLVDLKGQSAVVVHPRRSLLGLKAACINDIEFKDLSLTAESAVKASDCRSAALFAMDVVKVLTAAAAVGMLDTSVELAVHHAKERQQFGSNIGQFQGVQWKLADMEVELNGCRLQTYRAAWSLDEKSPEFHKYASMCKFVSARATRFHSGEALQILGASGLSTDSPVERIYRDAKVIEICSGTAEFQKMSLVKELNI